MQKEYTNLKSKKEQLGLLLSMVKHDFTLDEITEHTQQDKEVRNIIIDDNTLENVDIKCLGSIEDLYHRAWLFEYNNRGHILIDESNGHYSYFCTVEDFFTELGVSEVFHRMMTI